MKEILISKENAQRNLEDIVSEVYNNNVVYIICEDDTFQKKLCVLMKYEGGHYANSLEKE